MFRERRRLLKQSLIFFIVFFQSNWLSRLVRATVFTPTPEADHPLHVLARKLAGEHGGALSRKQMIQLQTESLLHADRHGRVTPSLQAAIFRIEAEFGPKFAADAAPAFQTLVGELGAKMNGKINPPEVRVPYWLKDAGPLDHFRSSAALPPKTKYLIIGSGLTGSSAARNLAAEAEAGHRVVVVDAGHRPASGASGRNGGNIEGIKESFFGEYRGFVEEQKDFIRVRFPDLPPDVVQFQAERQAKYLMKFFQRNLDKIVRAAAEDGFNADISMNGWLRIAEDADEAAALADEVAFAKGLGIDFEVWSPEKIKLEKGIDAKFSGRYIKRSGNYHPAKFVEGVMKRAIERGVEYHTETKVTRIEKLPDGTFQVHTNRGTIHTEKLLNATNGYMRELVPQATFIEPRVSHISDYRHVPDTFDGSTLTRMKGDWYANFPKQDRYVDGDGKKWGSFRVGGGEDTPFAPSRVWDPPYLDDIFYEVSEVTGINMPATKGQPPARGNNGVMAFTIDRMPVVSFHYERLPDGTLRIDTNYVVLSPCNGYGGSQAVEAGDVGGEMLRTGTLSSDLPDDVFSMKRFMVDQPLFLRSAGTQCESDVLRAITAATR